MFIKGGAGWEGAYCYNNRAQTGIYLLIILYTWMMVARMGKHIITRLSVWPLSTNLPSGRSAAPAYSSIIFGYRVRLLAVNKTKNSHQIRS